MTPEKVLMSELKIAEQDCFIRNIPDMYGWIYYARPRDQFYGVLENYIQKPVFCKQERWDEFILDLEPHKYDFVMSFNVINRMMSPLDYLTNIRDGLRGDGSLVLTTDIDFGLWKKENFMEYDRVRLIKILNKAGLNISKMKKLRVPWWRMNSFKWPWGQFWYVEAGK